MATNWDRVMKRLGLVLAGKTYCYECLCEPGAGNGFDTGKARVDLCFPCWEPYVIGHTVPNHRWAGWWNRLEHVRAYLVSLRREVLHRVCHLHRWEREEQTGYSRRLPWYITAPLWYCMDCQDCGRGGELLYNPDGRPWRWNPLAARP